MGAMVFQTESPASTLFTQPFIQAQIKKKHQSSTSLAICVANSPVTGEVPTQMASDAENVSISWRHHGRKDDPPQ